MNTIKYYFERIAKNISSSVLAAEVSFSPLSGNELTGSKLFSGVFNSTPDLPTFLNKAFELAIAIGAILAVLRIIYGGALYMGTDTFGQKNKAKEILQDAVLGLLLLLGTYIILSQINPTILNLQINPPSVQTTSQ